MGVGVGAGAGTGDVAASPASTSERLPPAPALTGRGGETSAISTCTGRQRDRHLPGTGEV